MNSTSIANLWPALWQDLHHPDVLWQIGTLFLCIALGWFAAYLLRRRLTAGKDGLHVVRLGVERFGRVLPPLFAMILLIIARPVLEQWHHANLLRLGIPLLGSFALIRLMFYMLRQVFARGGTAGRALLGFERGLATMVWLGVAVYVTGLWPDFMQFLVQTMIPVGRHQVSLLVVLQAVLSAGVTLILALWAGALLEERLMRVQTVHLSLRVVFARMGRATLILLAVLLSLSLVGIDLTVLSVFGGALGVGIGLGLQKIVSNYVSGFVILLERSLKIGDMVTVDRYSGLVTQINTRYTVLRGTDGVESVIPNEMLLANPVQNSSLTDRSVRLVTVVTVDYKTDVDHALKLLKEVTVSVPRVARDPEPGVFLARFGADGLELEVGFWIEDPENGRLSVLSEVNRAIWKALQQHRITVPYPQRDIRIVDNHAMAARVPDQPSVGTD